MTFEIYCSRTLLGRRWFWRLKAGNHRIIAVGGEDFHNKADVISIVNTMINELDMAEVKVLP